MRIFVKVRGNLKEVERVLGLSYPTIRQRFENLLKALGYEAFDDLSDERGEVIGLLERGEISPEDATKRLQSLKRRT